VRSVDGATPEVERVLQILVDDPVNLGGSDAVGEEAGDHGAGAAANVDVEVTDTVEPLLDRGDDADLVHPADDAAAGQSQSVAGPPRGPPASDYASEDVHLLRLNCNNLVSNRAATRFLVRKALIILTIQKPEVFTFVRQTDKSDDTPSIP